MTRLLAAEWIKLRHRWMPRILVLILVAITFLVLFPTAYTGSNSRFNAYWPVGELLALLTSGSVAIIVLSVLAGAWAGNEYSWGTIRLVLTNRPSRTQQYLSGAVLLVAFAAFLLLVALAQGAIVGGIAGSTPVSGNFPSILIKGFFAVLLSMVFIAMLAYTAGAVFRSPAAGIGVGIGLWIAETIVGHIFISLGGLWGVIANHFPYMYASNFPLEVMQPGFTHGTIGPTTNSQGIIPSLLGLIIYVVILVGIGLFVVNRRDVTA